MTHYASESYLAPGMEERNLGIELVKQERYHQAVNTWRRALDLILADRGTNHHETIFVQEKLAICLGHCGMYEEAIRLFSVVLKYYECNLAADSVTLSYCIKHITLCLVHKGDWAVALPFVIRSLKDAIHLYGPVSSSALSMHVNLSDCYLHLKMWPELTECGEQTLSTFRNGRIKTGSQAKLIVAILRNMATAAIACGDNQNAALHLQEAVNEGQDALPAGDLLFLRDHKQLSRVLFKLNQYERSVEVMESALKISRRTRGEDGVTGELKKCLNSRLLHVERLKRHHLLMLEHKAAKEARLSAAEAGEGGSVGA